MKVSLKLSSRRNAFLSAIIWKSSLPQLFLCGPYLFSGPYCKIRTAQGANQNSPFRRVSLCHIINQVIHCVCCFYEPRISRLIAHHLSVAFSTCFIAVDPTCISFCGHFFLSCKVKIACSIGASVLAQMYDTIYGSVAVPFYVVVQCVI